MIKLKSLLSENIKGKLTVYHGTRAPFKTFNIKNSTQGIIWFTSNKEKIINGEVGANGKGYIITANVTINNPAGWDEYDKYSLGELRRDNYDGAILSDGNDGFDCFVFSNKQIKILGIEKDEFKPPTGLPEKLMESLDSPYKYSCRFQTELIDYDDEETGETYKKDILQPVQIISFKTDADIPYIWYARQNRYDDTMWEIAFGVSQGQDERGTHKLDIGLTGTGGASRIFATVIDITNSFIEYDNDNYEIQSLEIKSVGDKRTNVYLKLLLPRIEKFKVDYTNKSGDETTIILKRYD
jgi:hypothetical protein